MDTRTERDTEIHPAGPVVYEPPMLDEIGGFTVLTCADAAGSFIEDFGYYSAE
jgi:hypothetical protein